MIIGRTSFSSGTQYVIMGRRNAWVEDHQFLTHRDTPAGEEVDHTAKCFCGRGGSLAQGSDEGGSSFSIEVFGQQFLSY